MADIVRYKQYRGGGGGGGGGGRVQYRVLGRSPLNSTG